MVVDVTKGKVNEAGMVSYPPVEGAKVTVTSRFNGKTVVGKTLTDKDGVVNVDIRQLAVAEKGEDVNHLDDYYFNGTVTVEKDGWRRFQTAKVVIEGGTGLQVPSHPADATGTPYPYLVSFDDWDALYSRNDFLVTSANADEHTIGVSILDLPSSAAATIELWVDGEKEPRQSAKAALGERVQVGAKTEQVQVGTKVERVIVDYELVTGKPVYLETEVPVYETRKTPVYGTPATATFKARFLKEGDPAALPVGATCKVVVVQDGKTYTWPLAFTTSAGVTDEPSDKQDQKLTPFNPTGGGAKGTGLDLKWPSSIPLLGGGNLSFWTPELPIGIYVNPFGMVQITLKSPSWGYLNDGGVSDKNGWGKYPRKTIEQQWDKKVKALKTMTDKTAGLISKPGAVQQIDLFKSFSVMVNFQLMALAKWNSDKGSFQGEVAGQIVAAMNFTISENFFAGPIPVLITFSLDVSLVFGLSAAAKSSKKNKNEQLLDAVFDFSRWHWDYANSGFTMTLNITPSLSVGVGLRGVASISVKGAITLTLFFGVPMGTQPDNLPSPHFSAGWSAQISLVIEMFLFTHSFSLYNKAFSNFYDNWNGLGTQALQAQAEDTALATMANLSIDELLAQMVPVTDDMLKATSEAELSTQGMSAQSLSQREEGAVIDWDALSARKVGRLNDEHPIELVVYDLAAAATGSSAGHAAGGAGKGSLMAASSPALAAGSRVTDGLGAQAAVPAVSWLTMQAAAALPGPGVKGLGAMGGIRPSSDTKVFEHVFGDPRAKVLALGKDAESAYAEGTWCFRIASVDVGGGQMRSRIVANCVYGEKQGTSRVIEFDTGISGAPHSSLYDYDFDVVGGWEQVYDSWRATGKYRDTVQLAIVSGKRQGDGAKVLANAACDLVVTALKFDTAEFPGENDVVKPKSGHCFSREGSKLAGDTNYEYHSILSVQMGLRDEGSASDGTSAPGEDFAAVTFIDRCAHRPEDVLGENAQVRMGVMQIGWDNYVSVVNGATIHKYIGDIDSSVYEMVLYPFMPIVNREGYPWWTIMLRGAKSAHYFIIELMWIEDTRIKRCADLDPAVRLVPCPAQGYFLTSYPDDPAQLELPPEKRDYSTWTLHKAWLSWENYNLSAPELKVAPIGPSGFNVVNFAANPRGTFIFWPQSRAADEDRVWGADGEEDVKERPASYQIMACRIRDDRFSDPFVVADLPHDTDMLAVLDTNQDAVLEALGTEHVDTGARDAHGHPIYYASDIWYTSVPAVRCATATACEAVDPFVVPGGVVGFHVAVRNDGNTFLSGCTLSLCAHDEATDSYKRVPGATVDLTFGKDTVCESSYNRSDGEGGLVGLEDDYALPPGKTSVYAVAVTIPASWESGSRKVLFVASDGVVAPDYSVKTKVADLRTQADGAGDEPEPIEFHIEPGDYNVVKVRTAPDNEQDPGQRHMDTLHVAESGAYGSFNPAPVSVSGGDKPISSEPRNETNSGTTPSPTRGRTPSTGDAFPLGLLGTALAAAGAATVAYERRRAENEARAEDDGS